MTMKWSLLLTGGGCWGCCCGGKEDSSSSPAAAAAGAKKLASVVSTSTTGSTTDRELSGFLNSRAASEANAASSTTARAPPSPTLSAAPASNLRAFTLSELKAATKNFSRSLLLGQGGFGCVYRGAIREAGDPRANVEVAVKQLAREGSQGHREWLTEVNVLGVVDHPHLVKLIGYCAEDGERGIERLLVYEYMPNRSVDDHLSPRASAILSWPMRVRVALDTARGLTYLHEEMGFQIIFRDLKTSNILLDGNWNARLSDFGLARHGPLHGLTHISTAAVGTLGYAAPEYVQTSRLTAKSDVWSYGVVLYELITGRRPIDWSRPRGEQKLLEWVKPYVSSRDSLRVIVDPRLQGQYSLKSVSRLAALANRCLVRVPKNRPRMSQVLEMVTKIMEADGGDVELPPLVRVADEAVKRKENGGRKWRVEWGGRCSVGAVKFC